MGMGWGKRKNPFFIFNKFKWTKNLNKMAGGLCRWKKVVIKVCQKNKTRWIKEKSLFFFFDKIKVTFFWVTKKSDFELADCRGSGGPHCGKGNRRKRIVATFIAWEKNKEKESLLVLEVKRRENEWRRRRRRGDDT